MAPRNYAMEIASALARADAQTLAEIGFELLASLGRAETAIALQHAADEARRQRDRDRKPVKHPRIPRNPQRSTESVESLNGSPHPSFNPSSTASSSAREADLAKRLPTDAGRDALSAVLSRVVAVDRLSIAAEIGMILDGGRPGCSTKPEVMEMALMDYASNGLSDGRFNAQHFRRHVQTAAMPVKPQNGNGGRRGGVGQRSHDNALEALKDV